MPTPNAPKSLEMTTQAELEEELRSAEQDFARGDFVEFSVQELDRCIEAGEWPWAVVPICDQHLFILTARGQPPVPTEP